MTQHPEATLAREAGIPYAGLALVTDYDAGLAGEPGRGAGESGAGVRDVRAEPRPAPGRAAGRDHALGLRRGRRTPRQHRPQRHCCPQDRQRGEHRAPVVERMDGGVVGRSPYPRSAGQATATISALPRIPARTGSRTGAGDHRPMAQTSASTIGTSTRSWRRSPPPSHGATLERARPSRLLHQLVPRRRPSPACRARARSRTRAPGDRSIDAVRRVHDTTRRVTHLVWSTPGRLGPMSRTGYPWSRCSVSPSTSSASSVSTSCACAGSRSDDAYGEPLLQRVHADARVGRTAPAGRGDRAPRTPRQRLRRAPPFDARDRQRRRRAGGARGARRARASARPTTLPSTTSR